VTPAIVTPDDRAVGTVFAATVKPTDPFPLPLLAPVSVIHVAELFAVHVHPDGAVTTIVPDPPAAGNDAEDC
jgi:hypothetical protein